VTVQKRPISKFDNWLEPLALECLDSWTGSRSPLFQLRACDLAWNFITQKWLRYQWDRIADVPVIFATTSEEGERAGLSGQTLWISLWGEIPTGAEIRFLEEAQRFAVAHGKSRLAFGGEEFHFSPGIPMSNAKDQALVSAAKANGFSGSEESDYVGSLQDQEVERYIEEATQSPSLRDYRLSAVQDRAGLSALEVFISREFPGRWTREFRFWRDHVDTKRAVWMMLTKDGGSSSSGGSGEIVGFARMAVRDRIRPIDIGWTPAAMRMPLAAEDDATPVWNQNDSCLGPIGVAGQLRGQGAGKALLGRVLQELRNRNAGLVCIDWTDAHKFYEPLQFSVARRYFVASKSGLI